MESPSTGASSPYRNLRLDLLRSAISSYLEIAYPGGNIPEPVKRRLQWADGLEAEALLTAPPFERVGKSPVGGAPIVALRLGNAGYPHMKLQVQPWDNPAGFLLSVNTHDQILGLEQDSDPEDAAAFRALQAVNQKVKEAIESAWAAAGLPTFNRFLRDYIASQQNGNPGSNNA